ncbi:MAG: hypothetical protein AAF968_05820 [Pseudomonadota bacterium]
MISIELFGPLRIRAQNGRELMPRGTKTRALVALLATNGDFRRSRIWLQDKLWSTRGPQQASASLRSALAELRATFGDYAHAVGADRDGIWLNKGAVEIKGAQSDLPGDSEFLQGLDVRDPEFESWLTAMRAHYLECGPPVAAARPKPAGGDTERAPVLAPIGSARPAKRGLLVTAAQSHALGAMLEIVAGDAIVRSALQALPVEVYRSPPVHPPDRFVRVHLQAFDAAESKIALRASIDGALSCRAHGAVVQLFDGEHGTMPDDPALMAFVGRLLGALPSAYLSEEQSAASDPDASLLASLAIQKIFSMRAHDLTAADTLLARAADVSPRGLFMAWRAQLAAIRVVEQQVDDVDALREEADAYCARALEAAPLNSYVLATVANARHVFTKDTAQYGQLAAMSLAADPANPLAWYAHANAHLYAGKADRAHEGASRAQQIADRSLLKGFVDFQRSLTAAVTLRIDEAIDYSHAAAALVPHFRPPLRYLVALHTLRGDVDAAKRAASRLALLEEGFSVDRMVDDLEYPVSLMREVGLIDVSGMRKLAEILHDEASAGDVRTKTSDMDLAIAPSRAHEPSTGSEPVSAA